MHRKPLLRSAIGALALAVIALVGTTPEAGGASKNLLLNPDMEQGLASHPWMPAGWDTSVSGLPSVFFGRDSFLVHSGKYSVNVANVSTVYYMAHNWSQTIVVGPEAWNKDAVFTVWTRSNGVEGRAYVLLQAYRDTVSKMAKTWGVSRDTARTRMRIHRVDDPLIDLGWKREFFSEPETDWVRRELRVFVPPSTNVIFVRCGIAGTGQLLIDDASLTLEPARPAEELPLNVNLITDPSFEGDGNDWEYSVPPFPDLHVGHVTDVSRTGKKAIGMWGGMESLVQSHAGVCQVFSNRNLAGKRVRLTAHVKTDSLQGLAYIKLFAHTLSGMKTLVPSKQFSMNTDWTATTREMDLPDDTYSLWVWSLYDCPARGKVYFDDMELVVLGPAKGNK